MVRNMDDLDFYLPSHAQNMLDGLLQLRSQPKLADVTLLVGGRELPCHRGLLALSSPYFHAMFAGDFAESFSARVELQDLEAAVVGQLVDFVYTGRLTITQANVEALTRTAACLHFPAVQKACGRYLQQQLDATNCLGICEFGEQQGLLGVAAKAWAFLRENFEAVAQEDEFLQLSQDRLATCLASDLLQALPTLPQELEEVLAVVGGRAMEEDEEGAEEPGPLPGNFTFYNTKAKRWMALPDFPDYHKWGFSLAVLNNSVYVTGGSRGTKTDTWSTTQAWCFPLKEAAWKCVAPMLKARTNHASAALNGEVYAIGGTTLDVVEVESYDPYTDTWAPVSPALKYVSNFSAAGCQGRLYLVGSSACKYNALALQCYNPVTEAWSMIASPFLPKYLSSPRCAALQGALYLVGDNTKKVYVYDPGANLWQKVQSLHSLHENGSLVPLGDALYLTGGRWQGMDGDYHVEMEAYDPGRNTWTRHGALPRLWLYHGASAIFLDVSKWTQPFSPAQEH
ncbi:kelch-like protein 30 isoform X2 [Rhinolophus sinicus]|uniref:kelch-like protein 30 isoform X2 n=1 Tax=Rhinolophus sinicus TaxID=89399 RepID=UPI003D7B77A5